VVADAEPDTVLGVALAGRTCLMSKVAIELASIEAPLTIATESRFKVNVADDVAVLVTAMLVTIAVVLVLGTVYNVVLLVEAAPLKRALDITAISYCILS
jgi:hypothetical protein